MHRHIARKCELRVMLIWIRNVCLREGPCVCSIPLDDYSSYNLNERQRKRKQEIYLGNSSAKSQWYGNLFYTVAVFFLLRCAGEYFNDCSIYFELNMSRILKVDFGKTLSAWAFAHSAVVEFGPRNFLRCIHSFYNIGIYCECKPNSLLTRFLPIFYPFTCAWFLVHISCVSLCLFRSTQKFQLRFFVAVFFGSLACHSWSKWNRHLILRSDDVHQEHLLLSPSGFQIGHHFNIFTHRNFFSRSYNFNHLTNRWYNFQTAQNIAQVFRL